MTSSASDRAFRLKAIGAAPIINLMTVHPPALSTLPHLRGLLAVTRLVREEPDPTRLVDSIAATIADSLGFRTVAISLYRPAEGDFEVTTVHGSDGARELLLGATRSPDAWTPYLTDRFLRRGAYLVPHDEGDWEGVPSHVPELEPSTDPDAWHPEDALMVPLRSSDGALLGVISVDEPESGLRPTPEELDVLVAFAQHVSGAIESARAAAAAARDRAALAQLLDVSVSLVDRESADSVLAAVAEGIRDALGFEKVAVCLTDTDGRYVPAGTAGWDPGDPALDITFLDSEVDVLFVPGFETEGCYLIEHDVANALVSSGSMYASERNGAGRDAWRRHWLLVPLVERDGARRGFIWVDDPSDCLLPSPERLQALRTFANQATMALRAAQDFETSSKRNTELAALHDTTVALLAGIEIDSVLEAILSNACSLLAAPYGYLYLPTEAGDELNLRLQRGLDGHPPQPTIGRNEGITGTVFETGEPVLVEDYATWSQRLPYYSDPPFTAALAVPLHAGGELRGVLGVAMDRRGKLDAADAALLERFAQLAALALENARLYTAAQRELDERRGAEEALRRSEELHRHVVDGSTDLIALLDPKGRIVLASNAYVYALGYSQTALVGSKLAELVHPDDLDAVRAQVVDGALVEPVTARLRASDGHWVLVEGVATPIRGDTGEIELVLVIARDVTERQRLEEQLRQGQKMESIGRLAGGIAHDFNNLLTAINGYAELMLMDFDAGTVPTRDGAEQIARAAGRAASLTSQLLAFSRKQVLRPQVIDLNDVVGGMAAMLARMLGEDVVLSTSLDPELGPTRADPTQIEQVILNLALNGRDAMPNGGNLELRTGSLELAQHHERPHPDLEPGSYLKLAVSDTGVGIEPSVIEKIFEPFFTTKGVGEGTGLGLATVHGIVSQSGGVVWVESTPGAGTTFTVCLPRAES